MRQCQGEGVGTLAHVLIRKDNRHIGRACERCGRGEIRTGVEGHLRARSMLLDIPQRRRRKVNCMAPPRRLRWIDSVATGRIHLRRTATRHQSHVSMSANDRDCAQLFCIERKDATLVTQQHNALFGNVLRVIPSAERIDHAPRCRRMIDDTGCKHAAE